MPQLGPITQTLEEEIKRDLRNQGLIIWLDKDAHYSAYVDQLIDRHAHNDFFAPVVAFRGSYLQLLFDLEAYGNGLDPDRLLIHMPGHTEETIRKTPILELYKPGKRFRKALPTLVREAATGRLAPNDVEAYLNNGLSDLASAETWLTQAIAQRRGGSDTPRSDLEDYLSGLSLQWILEGALGLHPEFQQRVDSIELGLELAQYLTRHTGFSTEFSQFYLSDRTGSTTTGSIAEAFTAWLMCVEYVHDLQRSPHLPELQPLTQLSPPLRQTCLDLVHHLRDKQPKTYRQLALRVEGHLEKEIDQVKASDLGSIDTFRWEEHKILDSTLEALTNTHWQTVLDASTPRIDNKSFWLSQDPERAQEWSLIHSAARFGTSLRDAPDPLAASLTLDDAIATYSETAYRVDQAHRQFEQQRAKLFDSALPHFTQLLTATEALRGEYRTWADQLCDRFCQLCQDQGFLPDSNLQQRHLFDQVVAPLTKTHGGSKPTKVAYFLIDAFRYEMAAELLPQLAGSPKNSGKNSGIQVHLNARYAELPTITAVGMNLLAPVHSGGKLTVAGTGKKFGGFKSGEYTVKDPKTRERAMGDRAVGKQHTVMLKLDEVSGFDSKALKRKCDKAQLIIVHSKEIDDAGEANVGPLAFAELLKQIKSACNRLRAIGIGEFVLTADHGFLLQEETFTSVDQGTKKTPERRYAFSPNPEQGDKKLSVSLGSLGYQGKDGHLIFLRSTEVFTTGTKGAKFVHGGNSLQERVIPVLTLSTRKQAPLNLASYRIEMKALESVMKMQRLRVSLKSALGVLDFTNSNAKISLGLRVRDRTDIQVRIKDVASAELNNQQILLTPNQDPAEIFFDLTGPFDERVQIEAYHPDGLEDVEPSLSQAFFPVAGAPMEKADESESKTVVPKPPPVATGWIDNFEDESLQRIFRHLEDHGSINEAELTQMLGNARKVRRFAKDFDDHLLKIPFTVHIEATASGKRYVRD